MGVEIALQVDGGDWSGLGVPDGLVKAAAEAALAEAGLLAGNWEISLLLTHDDAMAALNDRFRGRNAPTNVLSWPAFPLAPPAPGQRPPAPPQPGAGPVALGDIALSAETVAREAQAENLAIADHAAHLVVHGVLHLLGYDHATEADAEVMERTEREALARIGVADPYD